MGASISEAWQDGTLDLIATANRVTVCAGEPVNIADITTRRLAQTAMAPGDFAKSDGAAGARRLQTSPKADVNITANGDADHIVLDDGTRFLVFTCTLKDVDAGDKLTIPALTYNTAAPAVV